MNRSTARPRTALITLTATASLVLTACGGGAFTSTEDRAGEGGESVAAESTQASPSESTETEAKSVPRAAAAAPATDPPPVDAPSGGETAPDPTGANIDEQQQLIPPTSQGQGQVDISEYINFVTGNLDQMWSSFFRQQGMPAEPYVHVVIPGTAQVPTFTTNCGNTVINGSYPNAMYCMLDGDNDNWSYGNLTQSQDHGAIVIPADTMVRLFNTGQIGEGPGTRQSLVVGDMAVAFLVAHEFAHHVVDEYARQYNLTAYLNGQGWLQQPVGKWAELTADCLAGLWIWSAQWQQLLTDTDLQEALAAAAAIGDVTQGGPDPHGTGQERYDATLTGINTGSWDTCVNTYWKQDPTTDKNMDKVPDVQQNRSRPWPAGYAIPLEYLAT